MDEVSAILARNYGLRQPGKSAPMAAFKPVPAAGAMLGSRSNVTTEPLTSWNIPGPEQRSSSVGDPFLEDLGLGIPRGKSQPAAYDDIFGGPPSYSNSQSSFGKSASSSSMSAFDSVFDCLGESGHMSSSLPVHDKPAFVGVDMFDAVLSSKSPADKYDDVFFSFSSESNIASSTPLYPDPFVNLGKPISHTESLNEVKSTKEKGKNFSGTDELIPGFGVSSPSNRNRSETNQQKPSGLSTKLTANVVFDPFDFLETKDSNDIESFFTVGGAQARNVYPQWANMETMFDVQAQDNNGHHGTKRTSSSSIIMRSYSTSGHDGTKRTSSSSTIMKSSSTNNIFHDLFGDPPPSEEFHEIEGESEERRAARFKRHQETIGRVAKALAAKNERDAQIEQEQAERRNIAEVLDGEIKRWAAGKEGNLRALLASLQHVLWSDSGWQSVALTDLITAAAVKKVYRKATLCIHPDKMQQKGATLERKYISEKVFDLLKEAWKKFSSEELS